MERQASREKYNEEDSQIENSKSQGSERAERLKVMIPLPKKQFEEPAESKPQINNVSREDHRNFDESYYNSRFLDSQEQQQV